MKRAVVINVHPCDERARVVTVEQVDRGHMAMRREPCAECPWRLDSPAGAFPVEAYRHSAETSRDTSAKVFACHMASINKPQVCAGFRHSTGAVHNLTLRLEGAAGNDWRPDDAPSVPLFASYREMAVANGVDHDDPCLKGCR